MTGIYDNKKAQLHMKAKELGITGERYKAINLFCTGFTSSNDFKGHHFDAVLAYSS